MNKHIRTIDSMLVVSLLFLLSACGTSATINNGDTTSTTSTPSAPINTNNLINSDKLGTLKISSDNRMLQYADGTGFFWKGDTAWKMPSKSTKDDIVEYMEDRKEKGFSVIQVSVMMSRYFLENVNGDRPFELNQTPYFSKPNEKFWEHIDFIIDEAVKHTLYIALLPSWDNAIIGEENATEYATFIANRYKDRENIIWVVGGDSDIDRDEVYDKKKTWDAMGKTIDAIVDPDHLITYHPSGGKSSTQWFKDASWIDFHMIQSGHCGTQENANKLLKEAYSSIRTPVLDAEPRYENINACFSNPDIVGERFTSDDVREIAYRQLFSGAFGHTYGHHSIWQKYELGDGDSGITYSDAGGVEWRDALDYPGALQMEYLVKLMRSRPILNRVPDQSLIQSGDAIATRGVGYAFIYLPKGGSITVNLGNISGENIKAWWYNPRTGDATEIAIYPNSGTKIFSTGNEDMVLVLDDVAKGYDTPGQ